MIHFLMKSLTNFGWVPKQSFLTERCVFIDIYTMFQNTRFIFILFFFLHQRNLRGDRKALEVSGIDRIGGTYGVANEIFRIRVGGPDPHMEDHDTGRRRVHLSWRKTFYLSQLITVIWTQWGRGRRGSLENNEANL